MSELTTEIPLDKFESFEFRKIDNGPCLAQVVVINGIKISHGNEENTKGGGISSFRLNLPASKKPCIEITYNPRWIDKEVGEALGLYVEE